MRDETSDVAVAADTKKLRVPVSTLFTNSARVFCAIAPIGLSIAFCIGTGGAQLTMLAIGAST